MKFNKTESYIEHLRSAGRWSFTMGELFENLSNNEKALKQSLFRLKTKGKIAVVRSGFYVIIPPEFSKYKIIPTDLYIDDLMNALQKKYYVGLFTAAAMHGASHQAGMEYYVITEPPAIRHIKNKNVSINFFVKKQWPEQVTVIRKTDAGYIHVSSPELTAIDLLDYNNFSINKTATVLEELSDQMKAGKLKEVIHFSKTSAIQRLGYILDKVMPHNKFAGVLHNELKKRNVFPTPLLKGFPFKGHTDPQWKIIENARVESDL